MARSSPLLNSFRADGALLERYGPAATGVGGQGGAGQVEVVQAFEPLDVEYAALRRASGLIDLPQRATIEVRGTDRLDFLNRMLTQELKGVQPLSATRAFWLSRQGRIDADLRVLVLEDRVLLDVDVFALAKTLQTLAAYIISEDVEMADRTEEFHRFALHGPAARAALDRASTPVRGQASTELAPGQVAVVRIAEAECIVDRADTAGEIGLEVLVAANLAAGVHAEVLRAGGFVRNPQGVIAHTSTKGALVRPIGWGAYNVARIEAGTPFYFLDFGPTNVPHESGVLDSRVSFTKGCYLGQEIVARLHARGQPKERLVGLRLPGPPVPGKSGTGGADFDATADFDPPLVPQPVTGAAVFLADSTTSAEQVGSVCSSAVSPMLGGVPVCFAMVRSKHLTPGAAFVVECEGAMLPAAMQQGLVFWTRPKG
ncbi:MAG: YgfZ/GcvT domain-containing protein [Phycisphaerales bacterium]